MLSLANSEKRYEEIRDSGVMHYFSAIKISRTKRIQDYEDFLEERGLKPEQIAIVDDRTIRGIQAGNILGCETY